MDRFEYSFDEYFLLIGWGIWAIDYSHWIWMG